MTHNDYLKVIEDKGTATVKCIMIAGQYLDGGGYSGKEIPLPEKEIGIPFRLYKRTGYMGGVALKGSYPYMAHYKNDKRKGSFSEWSGQPDYYNTVD